MNAMPPICTEDGGIAMGLPELILDVFCGKSVKNLPINCMNGFLRFKYHVGMR